MSSMSGSSATQDLREIDLTDLARFKAAVTAGEKLGWAYYLPYLLSKRKPGREAVLIGSENDTLCLYQWTADDDGEHLDLLFPPLPFDATAMRRALERCNDHNGDRSARVMRIDEKDAPAVEATGGLRVKQRRSQYLFAPSTYVDLGGRRLRTVRRHVALFDEIPDVRVVPYTSDHEDACRALLKQWKREHRAAHGTAGGAGTTTRTITLAGGELIHVGERLVSFAFGGEIRPGVACFLDAKADASVPGLTYAHRRSFMLALSGVELVNDGSDTGREGLRQLKDSFRPVAMHAEFRASQRRG